MPLSGVRLLEAYAQGGGKLIFIGQTPTQAAGLADANDTPAVRAGIAQLLHAAVHVDNDTGIPTALQKALPPDVVLGDAAGKIGFLHRHLPAADIYFIANVTNQPVDWPVQVRAQHAVAEWWDTQTGRATLAKPGETIALPPYGSRLLVLHDAKLGTSLPPEPPKLVPLSEPAITLVDRTADFPGSPGSPAEPTQKHVSDTLWTDTAASRFYSGAVRYTTHFRTAGLKTGEHLTLQFAPGTPLPDTRAPGSPGMRAWFDPPVREAALIFVNGERVGALWHPPYALDVSVDVDAGEEHVGTGCLQHGDQRARGTASARLHRPEGEIRQPLPDAGYAEPATGAVRHSGSRAAGVQRCPNDHQAIGGTARSRCFSKVVDSTPAMTRPSRLSSCSAPLSPAGRPIRRSKQPRSPGPGLGAGMDCCWLQLRLLRNSATRYL